MIRAGKNAYVCDCVNLSEQGVLLRAPLGARLSRRPLRLILSLPTVADWIEVKAALVHHARANNRALLGMHFTDNSDYTELLLRRYLGQKAASGEIRYPAERTMQLDLNDPMVELIEP